MNCIDKVLEFYEDPDRTFHSTYMWSIKYIAKLANKKVSNFNESQFKDCLLLILNLFIIKDIYHFEKKGTEFNKLNDLDKETLIEVLEYEFNS